MREIEFRGKRIDDGGWVYGDLEYSRITDAAFIHTYGPTKEYAGQFRVDPATVGQYTGLTDKNGNKIFEGDIVRNGWTKSAEILTISWDDKRACFVAKSDCVYQEAYVIAHQCEVIGNIHDNPELIKTEKQ